VLVTMPVQPAGTFRYQVFTGPLDSRHLARLGHGLDDANPYGGIFRPIIQPVSQIVLTVLVWMHERLKLAYGWVLILFCIVIRVLWGLSTFLLSKVGQIRVPPNPQTNMLVYCRPVVLMLLFLNFASSLNLCSAALTLFRMPQQYMIANCRLREAPVKTSQPQP